MTGTPLHPLHPSASGPEPIAIVGMACRFPGAPDAGRLLGAARRRRRRHHRGAGRALGRWTPSTTPIPGPPGKMITPLGRLPRPAHGPVRRPLLRHLAPRGGRASTRSSACCWRWPGRPWRTPGSSAERLAGQPTGVFVGCSPCSDYIAPAGPRPAATCWTPTRPPAASMTIVANRLSYLLRPARARAWPSTRPAPPRWWRCTWPARACGPASATWPWPAAST